MTAFGLLDGGLGWPDPYLDPSRVEVRDLTGLGLMAGADGHAAALAALLVGDGPDYRGLDPTASLCLRRVLGGPDHGRSSRAIAMALDELSRRCDVVVMAFGRSSVPRRVLAALDAAAERTILVAAAGTTRHPIRWPARHPSVVSVGAVSDLGAPLRGHHGGPLSGVDLDAVGDRVAVPGRTMSGTSVATVLAAAHLAGVDVGAWRRRSSGHRPPGDRPFTHHSKGHGDAPDT